ncbi:XP_029652012.2uncharacterized protein LOC115225212 [Octopus vulgaris]|uniref:XP_029652012.2uncharacterized protein LOC115225212 n=1 Tax=Octopus vulgaris TaxID=6645 RepID=A0AA36C0L5_OCTVU|nr:XP_029652012.2uncharacterized protein LOC115225212 [Octopus vulgaris]
MVIGAKDVRSIKVSNLPENISNDVLRFLFKESTSVIRAPHSTTAIVEFNCVRDVAAYIHKDKTLMVEDKVLTIEGCSSKNEGTSNKDPLESRQLYIENIPHWTTTEYLDVLFPGAKSIRRVDGFTAVAEYRSAKDAQMELLKTKTLRIDQNQLVVVPAKDYRRNTTNNDGSPVQNVGRYSLTRKGKGYQSSYTRKPGFGSERSNPNNSSGGSYHSHKRHSASGSQHQEDNTLGTSPQDQLLSGNSTQANLLGLPQAFGKSSRSFQWKKPGSHHYSNVRSARRRGAGRNAEYRDGADAEGNECGDNDTDSLPAHDPDGDGDVVEKSRVEAKSSGQSQQQKRRTAATAVSQNQKDSKTHSASGPAVGPTQKEAKANQSSSSSALGRNQKDAKVTQRSSATDGVSLNQKDSKTNQKSADSSQNQTEVKANHKVPPTSKERGVSSRRESSMAHRSNSGINKTDRAQSSTSKPIRDRSPHRDCPSKRMRTTYESSTRGGSSSRGQSKTSREAAAPSSSDTSKGHRHADVQQGQDGPTQKEDGSVTDSVSNLMNKLDMLAALSQFAKDYEDAYQTTQKGSQEKCHETDTGKEKDVPPAGSTNPRMSKNRDFDRTSQKSSTGSSRVRHRGDSSGSSDCIKRGTSHDHERNTRTSESSRMRHRGDGSVGDGSCDSANRRSASRSRSSRSASWMSEPYIDSLRERHRYHEQSSGMATTADRRSARSVRSPCYDLNEGDGGGDGGRGGVSRRDFLERRNSEKHQSRGHYYRHGDNFDRDIPRHDRDGWNGSRFWNEDDSGRSRSSYANADVDLMRSLEVRGRNCEDRGSGQQGSERRVWISGRLDHRNSGQGRGYQRDVHSDGNYEKTVYLSNPDLSHWDEAEYDAGGGSGGGGGRRRRWEREEEGPERDRIAQRFSDSPGSCGRDRFGGGGYDDYNYDYDDDGDGGGGGCGGRRGVFDRRDGKWTGDRRDMYERRKTNDEPFVAVHLNSGSDRLAFGDRERDGEEELGREGRFHQESNERRYNHPDMDNDFHPHGNRRGLASSPSTYSNNITRSQSRDYYDSSSPRPPFHDNRRPTTTGLTMNASKSEIQDYEGDGTRHRGKRQNMTPHPYGPDTRTFRKGGDQGTAGNKSNSRSYHGDKEWSVSSRDTEERKVFLTNSVKRGGENCGRAGSTDGRGCGFHVGSRDVGRLGPSEKGQTGGFGTDGNREAGGRFGSDVRCESGRFVGAEGRCKVSRFGSDGCSEGARFGADEQYSSGRFGPDDDEHCKAGRFNADGSYEAGRLDVDERCIAGRFDVDERCATGSFDGNERPATTDVNDTEKRGSRSSGCDHDPSASRIGQKGEDEKSMGGRKFGVGAGNFGSCRDIDNSAANFRAGKSPNSSGRFDRHVNNDMQDCQLAFDVDERQRYAASEVDRMHNRNSDGMRFNRHRGIEGGNSPKTGRTLEEGANNKDDGGGDGSMRDDGEINVHAANSGGDGGGDDGGYSNHGENRDIDDRTWC